MPAAARNSRGTGESRGSKRGSRCLSTVVQHSAPLRASAAHLFCHISVAKEGNKSKERKSSECHCLLLFVPHEDWADTTFVYSRLEMSQGRAWKLVPNLYCPVHPFCLHMLSLSAILSLPGHGCYFPAADKPGSNLLPPVSLLGEKLALNTAFSEEHTS